MSDSQSPVGPRNGGKKQGKQRAGEAPRVSRRRASDGLTLRDIARLADVAPITVSRVLNQPDLVTPETIAAVRKVIDQTGYVPNLLAGGLASRRSGLIAAMVPSLRNMMFVQVVEKLNEVFNEAGYRLLLGLTGYPQREDELMATFLSRRPEAVILTGVSHTPETRQRLLAAKIPIVEIWDYTRTPLDMLVGFSHEKVGRDIARLFHRKGYRNIYMVIGRDRRAIARGRAFTKELARLGVSNVRAQMSASPGTPARGREAMARIIERNPETDAIFCSSDSLAYGMLAEANARGLRVPHDVAILGFGDLAYSSASYPPLSTVGIQHDTIGKLSAEMILARLNNKPVHDKVVDMGFEIIEREST